MKGRFVTVCKVCSLQGEMFTNKNLLYKQKNAMQELPYIPYNRSNKDYAKSMRRHMTVAEQRLWFEVLRHRPLGYKWIRQKMIEGFIADFYCSKL